MRVSLLTGGDDPNYAIPLAESLARQGIDVEFIGNDAMQTAHGLGHVNIKYLNLRGDQDPRAPLASKIGRIVRYYAKLIAYTMTTESRVFHILWLNKVDWLDRTLVNAFYRLNGKRVVFTAHNVNAKKRDGADTRANRLTLKAMYSRLDHIFVHTESAKEELVFEYGVVPDKVTVIPFGLNTFVPDTPLSKREARAHLGLDADEQVLLFFGQIAPYKGLDVLLDAFALLADQEKNVRLVIAGRPKRGCEPYWRTLAASLERHPRRSRLTVTDDFIPDAEVAIFFRAADVLVLPYRAIYQSGPLSLAYRFGVPVIATRVGCFNRDVVPGVTGLLCEPANAHDLARSIRDYFQGPLHRNAEQTRQRIRQIGHETYGWDGIGRSIGEVYARLEKGDTVAC